MTPPEALMWAVERDPILRSSFLSLTLLEGTPDIARFRQRMAGAVEALPRLRQRVRGGNPPQVSWPEWVDDDSFDLHYHVRHVALPAPGSIEQLLELAAVEAQDNFDLARPLWTIWVVEGVEGGRSALLAKMHHTITDGVGGVRLSAQFIDLAPDGPDPGANVPPATTSGSVPAGQEGQSGQDDRAGVLDALTRAGSGAAGAATAALRQAGRAASAAGAATRAATSTVTHPGDALETARSLLRQVVVTESARSPLWSGRRGLARHFEILSFDLDAAKRAANALGGTLNDLYVAGVAGGAAAYHRAHGAEVDELRMSMAINTRNDKSAGGNSFAPARVLVPAGVEDPRARFELTRDRLAATRSERSLDFADLLAGVLTGVPTPLLVRIARQQVETVDFATSNVRGAPIDLFVAGARILGNFPFGPTAGTAFNATVLSHKGSMDVGINIDTVAVEDPVGLRRCIEAGIAEVIAAGTQPSARPKKAGPKRPATKKAAGQTR
ncbi:MAG TPA: wax ester/triacylglycerol synthase domain-containing protein [Acidimicrobiales bacterium]|jgi:WS/DGAT/MGAT family acyltransferase|nr:wax ester/triacylglycerol synthase domain-containing protein [Acidimicrobiales bacterium]